MLRNFGFKWGFITLLLDMLKGALPALAGFLIYGAGSESGRIAMYACGLGAVIGHCFPVFSKLKGGKGVATTVGVFFVACPIVALSALAFGMLYGAFFEYASVSSLCFITAVVIFEGFFVGAGTIISIFLAAYYLIVLFTHRNNILRLLKGTENRASLFAKMKEKRENTKNQGLRTNK
jgi:glycerol-3-phosphate acyltransferase PlsY